MANVKSIGYNDPQGLDKEKGCNTVVHQRVWKASLWRQKDPDSKQGPLCCFSCCLNFPLKYAQEIYCFISSCHKGPLHLASTPFLCFQLSQLSGKIAKLMRSISWDRSSHQTCHWPRGLQHKAIHFIVQEKKMMYMFPQRGAEVCAFTHRVVIICWVLPSQCFPSPL